MSAVCFGDPRSSWPDRSPNSPWRQASTPERRLARPSVGSSSTMQGRMSSIGSSVRSAAPLYPRRSVSRAAPPTVARPGLTPRSCDHVARSASARLGLHLEYRSTVSVSADPSTSSPGPRSTRTLLIVEVEVGVHDLQAMLARLGRNLRLVPAWSARQPRLAIRWPSIEIAGGGRHDRIGRRGPHRRFRCVVPGARTRDPSLAARGPAPRIAGVGSCRAIRSDADPPCGRHGGMARTGA